MGTLVTNNHLRPLVAWFDLPWDDKEKINYLGTDEVELSNTRFVKYRGEWHDVGDAQRINDHEAFGFNVEPNNPLYGWDAIATDSAFSGTVFRFPTDAEVFRHGIESDRYDYIIVGRWSA